MKLRGRRVMVQLKRAGRWFGRSGCLHCYSTFCCCRLGVCHCPSPAKWPIKLCPALVSLLSCRQPLPPLTSVLTSPCATTTSNHVSDACTINIRSHQTNLSYRSSPISHRYVRLNSLTANNTGGHHCCTSSPHNFTRPTLSPFASLEPVYLSSTNHRNTAVRPRHVQSSLPRASVRRG